MATADELAKIKEFIANMPPVYRKKLKEQRKSDPLTCQFRDEQNHICAIYKVRPTICRMFGVVDAGGKMQCPYGNSNNLEPMQFLDKTNPPFPLPLLL